MNFRYKARDPLNRVVAGEMEGSDAAQIERELRGRALTPVWVRPAGMPQTTPVSILAALQGEDIFAAEAARVRESSVDGAEKKQGGVGWGTTIFILLYILLQIFGLL